jgi:two-component system phosphate regulon sensor histidine kinase PhoR
MRRTLAGRILPGYLAAFCLGLIVIVTAGTAAYRSSIRAHYLNELTGTAALGASVIRQYGVDAARPLFDSWDTQIAVTASVIDGPARFVPVPGGGIEVGDPATSEGGEPRTGFARDATGTEYAYVVVAVSPGDDSGIFFSLAAPFAWIDGRTRSALAIVIAAVLVTTAAMALVMGRYARLVNGPIRTIQTAARNFASGRLDFRLQPAGPEEIQTLARDLNHMAAELRARIGAISSQRNELETILGSMLEGVVVLDENRVILSMNAAAADLLEISVEESAGKSLIQQLRISELDELVDHVLKSGQPVERTITVYRDQPIHLQVHVTRMISDDEGTGGGVLIVLNDISRLEQLEQLRKDFVANVSHELKTPITTIQGFVETLMDAPPDDDQYRRFLEIILSHATRLNLIIEDLLSLSRIEAADERVHFTECEIDDIVNSVVAVCAPKADQRKISIEPVISGSRTVTANPSLLEQALVNLLDNAIKYSDAGARVAIDIRNGNGMLRVSVRDTGPGIRKQDLPRIFERFYRTDKARSRELGGTGLGLAIVKHIAIAHGGEVTVESQPGEGSTFVISIPQPERG